MFPTDGRAPSIPAWNGHEAAISWTFDDAFGSHLDQVVPYFDELGWPATFYPTCSLILADAERWAEAAERHEIGNHTMTHAEAGEGVDPAEVEDCDALLLDNLGLQPSTFAYPSGVVDEPYVSATRAAHVAARGTWGFVSHVQADRTPDWYSLPAYSVIPAEDDLAGTRIAVAIAEIETAIADGGWLSVVIHAIDEPGYARIAWSDLETMTATTFDADVWHVTVADAATHDRVRRNVDRVAPVQGDDGAWTWTWTIVPGMTDVAINLDPGTGVIVHDGAELVPGPDGYVVLDARVGSFTWVPG